MLNLSMRADFLTQPQQQILEQCSEQLKERLENRLLSSINQKHCSYVTAILTILAIVKGDDVRGNVNRFFCKLVEEEEQVDLTNCLKKTLEIAQKGEWRPFFQCADTQKIDYYSIQELCQMVDEFHETVQVGLMRVVSKIPHYDAGGKEFLANLRNQSRVVARIGEGPLHPPPVSTISEMVGKAPTLKSMVSEAIRYLASLSADKRLSLIVYNKFFTLLKRDIEFDDNVKIYLIKSILLATTGEAKALSHLSINDLEELFKTAHQVQNECGEEAITLFCKGLNDTNSDILLEDLYQIFSLIVRLYKDQSNLRFVQDRLEIFASGGAHFSEFRTELENKVPSISLAELQPETNIERLFQRFAGADSNVTQPLPEKDLITIKNQYEFVKKQCEEWAQHPLNTLVKMAGQIKTKKEVQVEDVLKLVAIGRLALRIKFHYPYNVQVIAVLGLLLNKNGCVAQVKTGEGKSTIVALHAFVLALTNQGVHIVSSSQNLAIRDQIKYRDFFKAFGISTSHICDHQPEARCFQGHILYGTATDYEFGLMREMLYLEQLFPQSRNPGKRFDNVLVDEVDNLTIDTAMSGARLGFPAEESFNWVYVPILSFVKERLKSDDVDIIKMRIRDLRDYLKEFKEGKYTEKVDDLMDEKLIKWMQAAYHAFYELRENFDYVIKDVVDKNNLKRKEVQIVDQQINGRILHGSRWQNGIHEFVELKHQIEPQEESVNPISLSHPIYYAMYQSVFGLTGTLGSESERQEIRTVYGVEMFDTPTYQPSQRQDAPPRVVSTRGIFEQKVIEKTQAMLRAGRPILILCESIDESQKIHALLQGQGLSAELLNEMQEKSEEEIIDGAGIPKAITIATNVAGRGTDIILKGDSMSKGGLHVLLLFYPKSKRVEDQARGRAGRQSQPGSSEILLCHDDLKPHKKGQSFSEAALLEELRARRKTDSTLIMHLHVCMAEVERFTYDLVSKFFVSFNSFVEAASATNVIESTAQTLSSRKLLTQIVVNDRLAKKDCIIAQEIIKLMNDTREQPVLWRSVLRQTLERLKERILVDWAHCYQDVQDLMRDSDVVKIGQFLSINGYDLRELAEEYGEITMIPGSMSREELKYYENKKKSLLEQRDLFLYLKEYEVQRLEEKIQRHINHKTTLWDKYFSRGDKAIIYYMREITGINFTQV